MLEIQMPKLNDMMGHRHFACTPSGHFVRCNGISGLQARWAHRLEVYVPIP